SCDVSDRDALERLLASIPRQHPLTAVFHIAGTADDGILKDLNPRRVDSVFKPKVDAALALHQLTAELDLAAFVTFSSIVAVMGSAGKANYGAANAFLDALAQHRQANGLPALSL